MSVNGPISPKQCYYEMDYSFYSFYWLDSLEIRLDHNSTYYRSLSKNSDVKPRISHCDSQNLQYKTHPEFWPFHRRIFKTSLYYKTRLILETRRYLCFYHLWAFKNELTLLHLPDIWLVWVHRRRVLRSWRRPRCVVFGCSTSPCWSGRLQGIPPADPWPWWLLRPDSALSRPSPETTSGPHCNMNIIFEV